MYDNSKILYKSLHILQIAGNKKETYCFILQKQT